MSYLDSLPEKLILQPIQAVPLPKHYHFGIGWAAGWVPPRRDAIGLYIGHEFIGAIHDQDEAGTQGFNKLLASLLSHAAKFDAWEQTVQCVAVAMGGPAGTVYVAKSNLQPLRLPVRPLSDIPINMHTWSVISGDTPAPLALPFPGGRRLYRRTALGGAPSAMAKLWYVRPDNRLEDAGAGRGFDRLTFWQAVFGLSIKATTNLASEDVMAKLLNAHVSPPLPAAATLEALLAALPPYGDLGRCLMWTQTRFVCVWHQSPNVLIAMEFDNLGFHSEGLQSWLAKENQGVVWSYRRFKSPTPAPASGLLSLP